MKRQSEDAKWSRLVRDRARNCCEVGFGGCHGRAVHAMHVVRRGLLKLRHDLDNGVAGCAYCHQECDAGSASLVDILRRIAPERYLNLKQKFADFYGADLDKL